MNSTLLRLTLPLLPAFLSTSACATTYTYFGANNGVWNLASNWNPANVPVAGSDVFLGSHAPTAGTVDLNVTFNSTYLTASRLNSLTLNSSAIGGFMILNQTSSSAMFATTENIGTSVIQNTYNQSAGSNTVDTLNIGVSSTQNAYNLSGSGTLNGFLENVGISGGGTFNQTGGNNTVTGVSSAGGFGLPGSYAPSELNLGVNAGSTGIYNLSVGNLSVDYLSVAGNGTGTFNQTGGNVSTSLLLGTSTGTGVYTMSGGTFQGGITVGNHGTFNFQLGTVTIGLSLQIAGGVFNYQGGTIGGGDIDLEMSGGALHLLGHSLSTYQFSGDSGSVDSGSGNATLTVNGASNTQVSNLTYNGVLQNGSAGLLSYVKTGTGIANLGGNNTYSGSTSVNQGTLQAGSDTGFSPNSAFLVNGGTLDINGKNISLSSLSGSSGTVAIPTGTLTVGSANSSPTYGGGFTGAGTLNKIGSGQWTLAGGGTYTGTINLQGGSLRVGAIDGLPTGSTLNLTGLGTAFNINFNQSIATFSGGSLTTLNFIGGSNLTIGSANTDSTFQGAVIGGGTITKLGTGILSIGFGAADTLNSNIDTGLGFVANAGTLALNKADGTNAIGGALTVGGGTVSLSRSNQIADTSAVTLNSGALNLNGFSETIADLAGNSGSVNLAGGALTVVSSATGTFGGALTGPGSFVKAGAADYTLTAVGNYGGTYTANAGRLIIQGASNANGYTANNGGILRFDGSNLALGGGALLANSGGTIEYNNAIVNNGFLRGAGTHTLLAGAANTLNNVTTYNSTNITQAGTASFSNFTNGGKLTNNATATISGGTNTSSGIITVNNTVNTTDFTTNGVVIVNNGGLIANTASTLVFGGGSRTTINAGGTVTTPSGTSFELNGALLTNNGSMTGRTNVNYGSLAKGAGTFGAVNVTTGGQFSPGNSPGYATTNGFIMGDGGSYIFEVNDVTGAAGVGFDYVNNLADLSIEAGTTPQARFVLSLVTLTLANAPGLAQNFDASQSHDFILMHSAQGITGFDPLKFVIDSTSFQNPLNGGNFTVVTSANDLVVRFNAVPEPSVFGSILLGCALLFTVNHCRRRSSRKA